MSKKISLGMLEAGVNAMARIGRTKQADAAVVSYIYNAMDAVRSAEERADARKYVEPTPYVHQDWPMWHCNGDQRKVFNSAADVPEGWKPAVGAVALSVAEPKDPPPMAKRGPGRPPKHVE